MTFIRTYTTGRTQIMWLLRNLSFQKSFLYRHFWRLYGLRCVYTLDHFWTLLQVDTPVLK